MDLTTAKYIMDYLYFHRANDRTFEYYKKVSDSSIRFPGREKFNAVSNGASNLQAIIAVSLDKPKKNRTFASSRRTMWNKYENVY